MQRMHHLLCYENTTTTQRFALMRVIDHDEPKEEEREERREKEGETVIKKEQRGENFEFFTSDSVPIRKRFFENGKRLERDRMDK